MAGLFFLSTLTVLATAPPEVAAIPAVEVEEVVVLGRRGAALVDPEVELDGGQIDALGAYDIGEVILRLTEDYGLGDRPMIVVNGRRMADPGVFSGFPPEALMRVEVLPPEAGGLYGATDPGRRVVNIVLQRRFQSLDGRASLRRPTAGGLTNASADARRSAIIDTRTRHLGLEATVDTALRAGERDQSRAEDPGGEAVTLRAPSETVAANLAETASFGDWSASIRANARAQESRSTSLRDGEVVESRRRSQGLTVTGGLNGDVAGWSVQVNLNGLLSRSDQDGLTRSDSRQQAVTAGVAVNRALLDLPAGPLIASLSGRTSRSRSVIETPAQDRTLSGRTSDLGGSLAIPLSRRAAHGRAAGLAGDLSMTLGADLRETGAGRGEGVNAALAWTPLPRVRINGSVSSATQTLSDQQRFDPESYGEPVTVFDFRTGESVEVLPILGGNPDLRAPRLDQVSLSVSAGPFTARSLQGRVNLQRTEAVDGIGSLPVATPEVEAAFPERFHRDADGRLTSIDQRPINLAAALSETLTTSLSAAFPLGSAEGGGRAGSLRVTLNHNWRLREATTIREGLPEMDRLAGDGGGLPRHQFGVGLDVRQGRWGMNAAVRRRESFRIRRDSGRDGPDDLRVAPFSAVDLRFNVQLERDLPTRAEGGGSRRGAGLQMELEVANLFDARPDARLGDGRPAPGYGRDDQDPVGRTARVTLKRRF